jgi:hypothetical protein
MDYPFGNTPSLPEHFPFQKKKKNHRLCYKFCCIGWIAHVRYMNKPKGKKRLVPYLLDIRCLASSSTSVKLLWLKMVKNILYPVLALFDK